MSGDPGRVGDEHSVDLEGHPSPEIVISEVVRNAPRPSAILKVADAYEAGGAEVLELFREVASPLGSAVFPIHLNKDGRTVYVEVETGEWVRPVVEAVIRRAAVLRSSHESDAEIRVLSAYPVPEVVTYLTGESSGALLQLDLYGANLERPEETAETFRRSAASRWQSDLEYSASYLQLVEDLILASLEDGENIVMDQLVWGLGCFLGETVLRSAADANVSGGRWQTTEEWEEGISLEFPDFGLDPVGKARAFLANGTEDSISFYAGYALRELGVETT